MNRYMQEKWPWIEGSHPMRTQLLDSVSDAELAFTPGGENMTLGALFREMGETEHAYVQSLKTFTQDWSYRNTEPGLDGSVAQLKAWVQRLYGERKATVEVFARGDLKKRTRRSGRRTPRGLP